MQKVVFAVAAVAMAGAATAFTTAPAIAATGYTTESVTIDTSGFDLRSASGRALAAAQIDRASELVCGTVEMHNLAGAQTVRDCQADAVADAMVQLNGIARTPSVTIGASR